MKKYIGRMMDSICSGIAELKSNKSPLEDKEMINWQMLPDECYSKNKISNIDGIVIHYISAVNVDKENKYDMDTIRQLFIELNMPSERGRLLPKSDTKKHYGSAHFLVGRDGEIYGLVPLNRQAWHAGRSEHRDRPGLNSWTIGIEVVGEYNKPFTNEQYVACAKLVGFIDLQPNTTLQMTRDLHGSDLTGHEHVATPPGRKKDPGPTFEWEKLWDLLGIA